MIDIFIFVLLINLLVPLLMIIIGVLWKNNSPKNINWIYGYRTSMSMKNNETWKFAHLHNAKTWRWVGGIWLIVSIVLTFIFKENFENASVWINYIGLGIMFLSLIPTEIAIRKKFDKDGNLRQ